MKPVSLRWKRRWIGVLLAVVLLGAGYYGLRYQAWPALKVRRIARMNREAQVFLDRGDLANALLAARRSLQASTANAEAWRLAAAAAKARELPEAVAYQESLCREEPTRENYLELMRLALHFNVPGNALTALASLGGKESRDPEFHRLAAQIYLRTGRTLAAKSHLVALTGLDPHDRAAQLDLAEIELAGDPTRKDPALRARILALADQPGLRVRARTLLLRENVKARVLLGTDELVRGLQAEPDLEVSGRLLVIEGLLLLGRPTSATLLSALQAEVSERPADAARVLDFFTRTGRPERARAWFATLPAATRKDQDVQHMTAEALLVLRDAAGLEALLRGSTWPGHEYLREALLARAYRDQGDSADFAEAWRLALIGTGSDLAKSTALLARVDGWRWVVERHEVVWRIFALVPDNESVQQILLLWERHQGNTANLNRLFTRIVEVQPTADARNNLAYTSLLLDSNVARAGLVAAKLAAAEPRNPFYGTTYALALYKQGHPAEALARLDAMSPSERTEPIRMLLRSLCLAALGRAEPASDLLGAVVLTDMLPEEKRLAETGLAEIARLGRRQGNQSRLVAFRETHDRATAASGWMALVAVGASGAGNTDLQLADSLYAAGDWDGLAELLRTTRWKEEDYLRTALLAHDARRRGDLRQSGEEWRQALALADRDPARLKNLRALVTEWKWPAERLETLNLSLERNPGDRVLLAELLQSYRAAGKTADLYRVLGLFAGTSTELTDEAVAQAYYGLLLELNLARAHVVARNAFAAAPGDPVRRMVYAFSLWKQHRAAEAMPLLNALGRLTRSDVVPLPLLQAAIEAEMGARDAARSSLLRFQEEQAGALPEEMALAARISARLSLQAGPAGSPPA